MTDRYVVAGNPVAHSRSPLIHARFAQQTGQDMEYRRLLVPLGQFAETARAFFAAGGKGMNVTVPFKIDAFNLAQIRSPRAEQAGAVNTLFADESGRLHGDNTDGAGLVRDLGLNLGWNIAGARVLLLGAGGAVRGVLGPLLAERPRALVIANRSAIKAIELARAFVSAGEISGCGLDRIEGPFDLIVNGTSASLHGEIPPLPAGLLNRDTAYYDMAYAEGLTAFLARASEAGAVRLADGIGMLVEQAAESFFIWRGVRPDTAAVVRALRSPARLRIASGDRDMQCVAALFREYQRGLGVELCFQGFEEELAGLPGPYAPPTGALLLAECAGEPVGCVALRGIADGVCEMKRLFVRPGQRGSGLGRTLAQAAIDAARAAGYATIRLDTLGRLTEAMALYQSLGFSRCAAYNDNPLADVVFWELDLQAQQHTDQGTNAS